MSWMRLLKASPTFSGMTQLKHRYRMRQMSLIPAFGSGKPALRESPVREGGAAATVKQEVISTPVERGGAGSDTMDASGTSVPAAKAGGVARLWKPIAALGALFSLKTEPRGVRLAPMPGRKLVQPELRLAAVKPVRNDLSDCEFEVREVRLAARAAVARESGSPTAPARGVEHARIPAR